MNVDWVEQGRGAAFSIPMAEMRQKPSGKKAPHHFLKKGTRATVPQVPEPSPKSDIPRPRVHEPPTSIRSRIQNYRKDAVPRDKFEDAVVVVPKRPSTSFDAAQYQKQTEETAQAYIEAKDRDDETAEKEGMTGVSFNDSGSWHDGPPEPDTTLEDEGRRREELLHGQRRHGGAAPRARGEDFGQDDFEDEEEDEGAWRPPAGKINQQYSRRPQGNRNADPYSDALDEADDYEYHPPPRPMLRARTGAGAGPADGFKQFLVDKMKELEEEIATYKKENTRLQHITREQEIVLQKLMEEKEDSRQQLEEEQAEFERHKEEEIKRLKAKAKQMEIRAKEAAKVIPKREREEIEMLSAQLDQLREEMRGKDAKARAERERLRKEVQDLQLQNAQLQAAAREQQLREIHKKFDARAEPRERRRPTDRTYQRQYEQLQHSGLEEGSGEEEEEEDGEEEAPPAVVAVAVGVGGRGAPGPAVANQGRAPPSSAAPQTGGKLGHPSTSAGAADKRRPPPGRPGLPPAPRKEVADSEDDPPEDLPNDELVDSHTYPDNKVQRIFSSGKREIVYTNGTVKKLLPTGHIILHFSNGDIKKTFPSSKIIYYYALAQTTHTTYPNGMQVFEFVNQQVEKHYPDGMKEIAFPDGTIKYIHADGTEESLFPTGATQAMACKLIKSSSDVPVAKTLPMQPADPSDDRSVTLY